tara:strand:+ start:10420 stop:11817 length:1398 start_codon:yes stop_codon:yes gene_type:complete
MKINIKTKVTQSDGRNFTSVFIPKGSKTQYKAGSIVLLYDKHFSLAKGHYASAPKCILKSKNKERYVVSTETSVDGDGNINSARISISYIVQEDNILPKFTGDSATINFTKAKGSLSKLRITSFKVDTKHVTSDGERRQIRVIGAVGCRFQVEVRDADGEIIKQKINNLTILPSQSNSGQGGAIGEINTSISIPESASSTTYTVSIQESSGTFLADNVSDSYVINQYGPVGINVSISSTSSTGLVVTGTTPVALSGIEVNSVPTTSLTANWVITKGSSVKIYAHRQPVLTPLIAYNENGSSDYTNALFATNGGTTLNLQPTVTQTNGTTVTMVLVHDILAAGTESVSPVLNLDNFISVKPPARDVVVKATVGLTRSIKLASETNLIPISSGFMTGGWSTVVAPPIGSLSSYGAYDGNTPGEVTYTAPTKSQFIAAGKPRQVSFAYKVNDGTTDSDTATVTINLVK